MIKHASSHGFAVLATTIASSFLVELMKPKFPVLLNKLEVFSIRLVAAFNIPINPKSIAIIIVASILAMIWGAFFKLRQRE